jgi:hypothetical protein
LLWNGVNLYAGVYDQGIKVNIASMAKVSQWNSVPGEENTYALAWDGTYVYVAFGTMPAIIVKINPVTMLEVARWTGAAGEDDCRSLTWDGTYLYIGLLMFPATVVQINPITMAETIRWTGPWPDAYARGLVYDGTYIYASISNGVVQIDPTTMLETDRWNVGLDEFPQIGLARSGAYLYLPVSRVIANSLDVIKIDSTTMLETDRWTHAGNTGSLGIFCSNPNVYITADIIKTLFQINTATMTTVNSWIGGASDSFISPITADATPYIYTGGITTEIILSTPTTLPATGVI